MKPYRFKVGNKTLRYDPEKKELTIVKVDKFEKVKYKQTTEGWVRK